MANSTNHTDNRPPRRKTIPSADRRALAKSDYEEMRRRADELPPDLLQGTPMPEFAFLQLWMAAAVAHDCVWAHYKFRHEDSGSPEWMELQPWFRIEAAARVRGFIEFQDQDSPVRGACASAKLLWFNAVLMELADPSSVEIAKLDELEASDGPIADIARALDRNLPPS